MMREGLKLAMIVFAGSGAGGVARWAVQSKVIEKINTTFPVSTFIVNISGCLLIGLIYGFSAKSAIIADEWKLALITGFCGGYTTFSTFSFENVQLLKSGYYLVFFLNFFVSVFIGVAAVALGIFISKL